MRGGTNSSGYTIVEALIFVTVSGLMFLVAASFIAGKQDSTQFRQGLYKLNAEIGQTIDEVGTGYYPATYNFKCAASASSLTITQTDEASANEQGTNKDCIFMGKIIALGEPTNDGEAGSGYSVYSVAGRREVDVMGKKRTPVSFDQATPAIIKPITQTRNFSSGIRLVRFVDQSSGSVKTLSALGIFSAFGSYSGDNLQVNNATVVVPVVDPLTTTGLANQFKDSIDAQDIAGYDSRAVAFPNITLCFSGGKELYGTITIGGDTTGKRLATRPQIYTDKAQVPAVCGL